MKISIITITFNSEKTLKDTFESVLNQEYRPLEYIVIDGKSTDSTLKIINEYENKFKDREIGFSWISEKDEGISDAFNKGIRIATGDLIGIINSDDMLAEGALLTVANNFNEKTDVYYGNCIIFSDVICDKFIAKPSFCKDKELLKIGMALFHPSCFVSKRTYDRFGCFDKNLRYCMDRDFLLRVYYEGGTFTYIDSPLALYREGGTNQLNYKRTAEENMNISIKYGMNPFIARLRRLYFFVHDYCWKIIQTMKLERYFHKLVKK